MNKQESVAWRAYADSIRKGMGVLDCVLAACKAYAQPSALTEEVWRLINKIQARHTLCLQNDPAPHPPTFACECWICEEIDRLLSRRSSAAPAIDPRLKHQGCVDNSNTVWHGKDQRCNECKARDAGRNAPPASPASEPRWTWAEIEKALGTVNSAYRENIHNRLLAQVERIAALQAENERLKARIELFANELEAMDAHECAQQLRDEVLGGVVVAPTYTALKAQVDALTKPVCGKGFSSFQGKQCKCNLQEGHEGECWEIRALPRR